MEWMTTKEVCAKGQKALNVTIPHCQASAEKVWGMAASACHKGTDFEKWLCGIADNKQMEDKVVDETCAKIHDLESKSINISMPLSVCKMLVNNTLQYAAKMCPKDGKTMVSQAIPSSSESKLCATLDNKFMEWMTTKEVCAKGQKALNVTIPHCQASAEKVWDMAASACNKGTDFEKWLCGIADNKQMEDKVVDETCAKIHDFQSKSFNISMPLSVCKSLANSTLQYAAKMCPKDGKTMLSQAGKASTTVILI